MSIQLSIIMDVFCESRTALDGYLFRSWRHMTGLLHVCEAEALEIHCCCKLRA
jgi:hypothetical protein